jgi:hypothetical protein
MEVAQTMVVVVVLLLEQLLLVQMDPHQMEEVHLLVVEMEETEELVRMAVDQLDLFQEAVAVVFVLLAPVRKPEEMAQTEK